MRNIIYHIICAVLLVLLFTACTSDGCYNNSNAIPKAVFYQGKSQVSISGLSVKGVGAPNDSLLIEEATVSEMYIPLPVNTTTVSWVLDFNLENFDPDTITLNYEPQLQFVSRDCGAMFFFKIQQCEMTRHVLDRIEFNDSLITNVDRTYVKIYLQETSEEED